MESIDYEQLEAYLSKRLNAAEMAQLHDALARDPQLAQELDRLRVLKEAAHRLRTRQIVQQVRAEVQQAGQQRGTYTRPLWTGASVLVAACLGFLVFLWVTPLRIAPPEAIAVERGKSSTLSASDKALFDYFYQGQQLLAEQRYLEAIVTLNKVLQSPDVRPYYQHASQWFLVVAYTETNQSAQAQKLWDDIQQNPRFTYPISWLDRCKISLRLSL